MKKFVTANGKKPVQIWLIIGIFMVFAMIAIGGITRLTESGLSITDWNVVMGTIPPMSDDAWNSEFNKYKSSPEFIYKNIDFTIDDFKKIFFWEWFHRFWGRLIGIVFLIPFIIFLTKKYLTIDGVKRLVPIFILGGIQAYIGWYMVQSGLVNEPRVSHYRLALHLFTALLTITLIWWLFLDIQIQFKTYSPSKKLTNHRIAFIIFFVVFCIQVLYGAFVAGLDLGQMYNSWPKMDDHWISPYIFNQDFITSLHSPESQATIQFIHRTLAIIVVLLVGGMWFNNRRHSFLNPIQKNAMNGMMIMVILQFILGVFTLIYNVPIILGVLHQLGAVLLLLYSVLHYHTIVKSKK